MASLALVIICCGGIYLYRGGYMEFHFNRKSRGCKSKLRKVSKQIVKTIQGEPMDLSLFTNKQLLDQIGKLEDVVEKVKFDNSKDIEYFRECLGLLADFRKNALSRIERGQIKIEGLKHFL